jgi:hypothetical protein
MSFGLLAFPLSTRSTEEANKKQFTWLARVAWLKASTGTLQDMACVRDHRLLEAGKSQPLHVLGSCR